MSDNSETPGSEMPGKSGIKSFGHMLLGLAALPFLLVLAPIAMGRVLLNLGRSIWEDCVSNPKLYLTDPMQRKRISYRDDVTSAGQAEMADHMSQVKSLVQAQDWVAFGTLIQDWDQTRKKTVTNYPLADAGIEAALNLIAGEVDDYDCGAMANSTISDQMIDQLETATALHPTIYPLAVLVAELHMRKAWQLRGGGYVDSVPDAAWPKIDACFERADWLLQTNDPKAQDAPLLAYAQFGLCDHLDPVEAAKRLHRTYQIWCDLDPQDMRPYTSYAFKMLPRWYGTYQELDMALRKAVPTSGAKAYAAGYLNVATCDDGALAQMDAKLFAEGIEDLVLFRGRDPAHVAWLTETLYDIGDSVKQLARRRGLPNGLKAKLEGDTEILLSAGRAMVQNHLTGLNPTYWDGGIDGALDHISLLFQKELRAGAQFAIAEDGLAVTVPE